MTIPCSPAAQAEPIAIVGIGCRFPGANDPRRFPATVAQRGRRHPEVPAQRFDLNAFYDPDPRLRAK